MWLSFEIITRVVVGGFMLLAGVAKLSAGPAWRRRWLRTFRLMPAPLTGVIALGVAAAEVSAGASLLAGASGGAGAAVAAGLLGLVTGAVAVSLLRGLRVPCGCLGRFGQLITWRIAARNLILIAAVTALAVHGVTTGVGAFPWPAQPAVVAAVLAVAAAVSQAGSRGTHPRVSHRRLTPRVTAEKRRSPPKSYFRALQGTGLATGRDVRAESMVMPT